MELLNVQFEIVRIVSRRLLMKCSWNSAPFVMMIFCLWIIVRIASKCWTSQQPIVKELTSKDNVKCVSLGIIWSPGVVALMWAICMIMNLMLIIWESYRKLVLLINIASIVSKINVSQTAASLLIPMLQGFARAPQQLSLIAFTTPQQPLACPVITATSSRAIPASRFPSTIV